MPVWMYKASKDGYESRLFQDDEVIGKEWLDTPAKITVSKTDTVLDIDALKEEAEELGIKVHHKAKSETIAKQIAEFKGE